MRILVYGLGRSGQAAAELCLGQGHQVVFFDRRGEGPDVAAVLRQGGVRLDDTRGIRADLCIAAPGVPIDHPDLAELRSRGIETIGEVEWVFRTVSAPIIGITGTAGKGTTTRWLTDLLARAGIDAVAGGNIDPALARIARPGATLVAEMSSFQLERCPTLRPRVAVVLNLGEDHLDRHGTVAGYHQAKRALLANLGPEEDFVYNADDPILRGWAEATPARSHGFSLRGPAAGWYDPTEDRLMLEGLPLLPAAALRIRGRHQIANALAAALAARALGVPQATIRQGLETFEGLPGRYALAGSLGDIEFIDDSIATRTLAVAAALETTPAPIVWLAGGHDKGVDPAPLAPLVRERVTLMLGIGASGPALAAWAAQWTRTGVCRHPQGIEALRCAVGAGVQHLHETRSGRGTVLLAPLAASFDQFDDYAHRSRAFRQVVEEVRSRWIPSC